MGVTATAHQDSTIAARRQPQGLHSLAASGSASADPAFTAAPPYPPPEMVTTAGTESTTAAIAVDGGRDPQREKDMPDASPSEATTAAAATGGTSSSNSTISNGAAALPLENPADQRRRRSNVVSRQGSRVGNGGNGDNEHNDGSNAGAEQVGGRGAAMGSSGIVAVAELAGPVPGPGAGVAMEAAEDLETAPVERATMDAMAAPMAPEGVVIRVLISGAHASFLHMRVFPSTTAGQVGLCEPAKGGVQASCRTGTVLLVNRGRLRALCYTCRGLVLMVL